MPVSMRGTIRNPSAVEMSLTVSTGGIHSIGGVVAGGGLDSDIGIYASGIGHW